MERRYKLIFIINCVLLCLTSSSYGAELIWSETSDEGSTIYRSKYRNASLVKRITVMHDGNLNILPAISTSKNGSTIIVWSRLTSKGSVLDYILTPAEGRETRGTFKTDMATNLAPVIIHDNNNIPWLFWSANNGRDDNIFFSRFISKKWQEPIQINTKNSVPDILPEAGVTKDGTVWVSWQQLSNNSYIELTKTFKNLASSKNNGYQDTKETIISSVNRFSSKETAEIVIPKQINTLGRIMHFSRNGDTSSSKSVKRE